MQPFEYNPLISRSPQSAVSVYMPVHFSLTVRCDVYLSKVVLVVIRDGDKREFDCLAQYHEGNEEAYCFTAEFVPRTSGLYWYYFLCFQNEHSFYICSDDDMNAYATGILQDSWQLTVCDKNAISPTWMCGRTMYHIFVDRFKRGAYFAKKDGAELRDDWGECPRFKPVGGKILNNDFFCGNLRGIIEELDYLESLRIGVLYLSPIFQAASNHRYDTGDYSSIDELLGTQEDFCELCEKASQKDIRIILDGVFNHTGDDSLYFNKYGKYPLTGAYQSQQSAFYDWYKFNNYPDGYASWWGIDTLPAVNQQSASYIEYISGEDGIATKWLRCGASGYRLDVVDELTDDFLDPLCTRIKREKPDSIIIGEVWEDASNKSSYGVRRRYFLGGQLDSVMNYPIKEAIIAFVLSRKSAPFVREINKIVDHYPKHIRDNLMNILSTHDTVRILTILASAPYPMTRAERAYAEPDIVTYRSAVRKLKFASLLQFTIFGVPCVFYGDEAGLVGYEDPFNRRCFPWGSENRELLDWYGLLGKLRQEHMEFAQGEMRFLSVDENSVVFSRGNDNSVVIAVNLSENELNLGISESYIDYLTQKKADMTIPADSFAILTKLN